MINLKCLALFALLLALPATASESDIAQRAQRLQAVGQQWPRPDDLAHAARMQREYASAFGAIDDARSLHKETDEEIKLHWGALETAAFYSDDGGITDAIVRVYAELERRQLAEAKAARSVFNSLLKARRFDAAREFATHHPDAGLPSMPKFTDTRTDLPSAWRFDPRGDRAERIGIDLQSLQILVAAGCHFSADAANDIAADPVLGPIFARHAHWLALPPGSEDLDALAEWNRAHPQTPMLAIHDRGEWTVIPKWDMPTFAIIRDGRLIDSTKGWRGDDPEFRARLVALLARAGLLEAGTR